MPWTTTDQVLNMTGKTVDEVAVRVASSMIDTKAGVSEDLPEDAISPRDRAVLGRAAAWQAVWIASKLETGLLDQRESTRQTSAAGVSDRRDTDAAILYAPLALLELRNLSWAGTRSVDRLPSLPPRFAFLDERSDVYGEWKPVP